MTPDVNIVLLDFHEKPGREMVVENEDGSFTIIVNARLSRQGQIEAYYHAKRHIDNGDFQKENVQIIETVAHNISIPDNVERIPANKYEKQIKAIQRRRRKIQKQLKQYEEDMAFIGGYDSDAAFDRAERQWLYGNDL